jgi:hypothetical protein
MTRTRHKIARKVFIFTSRTYYCFNSRQNMVVLYANISLMDQEIVTHYLRRLAGTSEQVYLALLATLTRNQKAEKSGHEIGWRTGSEDGKSP